MYGPIEVRPTSLTPHEVPGEPLGRAELLAALLEALDGVALGAYDREILAWLAQWGVDVVAVVVSLLWRRWNGPEREEA
jgi:hypothetical protein